MIRIYKDYAIRGKEQDIEEFEQAVTRLASDVGVQLSGTFDDEEEASDYAKE